jgi:peptide/nickel transport system ATP-binding protein
VTEAAGDRPPVGVDPLARHRAGRGGDADEPLLAVAGLRYHYATGRRLTLHGSGLVVRPRAVTPAVDGVDLTAYQGQTLALVGESGCGKSTTARLLVRLLEPAAGRMFFDGRDITRLTQRQLRPLRKDMQLVFQDAQSALNPRHTVGAIVGAAFTVPGVRPALGVRHAVRELLELVGLNGDDARRYPHELSGGGRQRVGIARALAPRPKLVVADEPVSALDTSVRAQVLNLLADLQREFGLCYVLVAHDLSVVRHVADQVAVMYRGRIVESADRDRLYTAPAHPYTRALLAAVPVPDPSARRERGAPGTGTFGAGGVTLATPTSGCRYAARCPIARAECDDQDPLPREIAPGHRVACHFPHPPMLPASNLVG